MQDKSNVNLYKQWSHEMMCVVCSQLSNPSCCHLLVACGLFRFDYKAMVLGLIHRYKNVRTLGVLFTFIKTLLIK